MFDIGLQEMVLIGVLALLVFGPSKLPELGRMVGRALREFRRASDEFRSTVETNLNLNEPDPVYTPGASAHPPAGMTSTESAPGSAVSTETLPSETEPATAGAAARPAGDTTTALATETEPSELREPAEPFCAQRGSRLFHRRECSWVARIGAADRVPLKSVAEAREQGFTTCPVCEPWEPG
ncbi:MAG: twin-arginine translocase TatA/TatE family subunit [Candidatus Rokubacteria bacterium]|nr:twin-arginine translocase TatA/TatE family subunit [Candidatus Rokubacteria bacterium]